MPVKMPVPVKPVTLKPVSVKEEASRLRGFTVVHVSSVIALHDSKRPEGSLALASFARWQVELTAR